MITDHKNPEGTEDPGRGDPRSVDLIVLVGLQASGKSTFFRERFAATHEYVSKDLFPNNRDRNRRQARLIEAALSAGSPVVVDNTNPTPEDRRAIVELGREHGARIICYYFEPLGAPKHRAKPAARREGQGAGRRDLRDGEEARRPVLFGRI